MMSEGCGCGGVGVAGSAVGAAVAAQGRWRGEGGEARRCVQGVAERWRRSEGVLRRVARSRPEGVG